MSLQSAELATATSLFSLFAAFNTAISDLSISQPSPLGAPRNPRARKRPPFWQIGVVSSSTEGFEVCPAFLVRINRCFCCTEKLGTNISFREKSSELSWHSAACSTSTDHCLEVTKGCGKPFHVHPKTFFNTDPKTGTEQKLIFVVGNGISSKDTFEGILLEM